MLHGASLFRNRDVEVLPIFVSIAMVLAISAGFMTAHQDWTKILPNMFDVWSAWDDLTYMWLPEHAFAQSIPPTLKLTTTGSISDDDGSGLGGARILATFESNGRTYAAVASSIPYDRGVQILDLTDPSSISVVGDITYEDSPHLNYAWGDISVFKSDGHTYAAVASFNDDHIQILNLTDPSGITLTGSTASLDEGVDIVDTHSIDTFESNGRTYAAVASDLGIQILNLTDPSGIIPAGDITYYDDSSHTGTSSIATFKSDGHTYAAIGSIVDDAFQILNLTDPHNIFVVSDITDNDDLYLNGVWGIDIFESDGHTYAAVASFADDGVQILDLTDPHNIFPAGGITDNDNIYLDYARDISTFESDGHTYAAVTSFYYYNVVQILDLTDPHNIFPADGIAADVDIVHLYGASDIDTFESDGRTYAAVAAPDDDGVQILDLTDPYNVTAADGIGDIGDASHIAVFESDGLTYAAVVWYDGVQILDLTDPHNVTVAGSIANSDDLEIVDVRGITTFESDGRTYAAIVLYDGVQILDLTDPSNIMAVSNIADDANIRLGGASDVAVFESDGSIYAVLTSQLDGGTQILDLTNPYNIAVADGDYDDMVLEGATHITTFESDGRTYAAVASFADDGVQILDLTDPYDIATAGSITDTGSLELEGARGITTFESDGRTYAVVGSFFDDGVQILDLTDPYDITATDSITDNDSLYLGGVESVTIFESDNRTYAAITSRLNGGVQILDLTDPYNIATVGSIIESGGLNLHSTYAAVTFQSDGRTYAVVVWRSGVQILDLTDPYSITTVGSITDTDLRLGRDSSITTFESDGRTYVALASRPDGVVQILDLTDPYDMTITDSIMDNDSLYLRGAAHITTFESDGRTYAAVASHSDDGVQILDLTDPYDITAAGGIAHIGDATHITTFGSDGRTYAAVSTYDGNIQILDLTDPYSILPAGSIAEVVALSLYDTDHIATFESDGRTYAAVISAAGYSYGVQILDLTNPYDITAAGYSGGDGLPTDITVLELDGRTYVAVALHSGGIHILDLTDPYNISPAGGSCTAYGNFYGITSITTFELDDNTYVAVTSPYRGVQTLQLAAKEPDACIVHTVDATAPAIPSEIAATGNRFAVDLYGQVSGGGDNVFFSPISAYVAFSMVSEAARGETASQLQGVFGFEPDDGLRHNVTATLVSSLNRPDPCATLQLANSLWLAEQFEPYDSYIGVVGDAYQADIETVDFMDGGVDRINGWASEKTQGKIPKVLDPDSIPENMTMAILNAIYFKGTWEEPFPVGNTHKSDFWTGTQKVKADFMSMTTRFGYAESDGVQVLNIPYQGDRLSMLIMLPSDRDGLDHLERIVTSELIDGWQESLRTTLVRALVPKFEMDTHYNLTFPLVNMGVEDVFDPRMSDLSGMAHLEPHEKLYVNIAIQDAYVKVNEEGTEAAAVTTIGGAISTSLPPEPVPFIADHPFLFLIQDDKSGTILFMGRVSDPS